MCTSNTAQILMSYDKRPTVPRPSLFSCTSGFLTICRIAALARHYLDLGSGDHFRSKFTKYEHECLQIFGVLKKGGERQVEHLPGANAFHFKLRILYNECPHIIT